MSLFLLALGFLSGGGLAALVLSTRPRAATCAGTAGAILGGALGFAGAVQILSAGATVTARLDWQVPYGSLSLSIDPLAAFFLLPLFALSTLAALFGASYLYSHRHERWLGPPWFFYDILVAAMALVVAAANAILFLVAWEMMALASFFLVTFDDHEERVRRAGWTYLVASHLGTAFLFAFFLLLGRVSGSLDFEAFAAFPVRAPHLAWPAFLLALIGFGAKAGFLPLHVWLPEAHPAAPSHVSALMSGVLVKMGIYGILRALTFLGPPRAGWGLLLAAIGLASAGFGILYALAQSDLKRLLAYSTVENIGIVTLGIGLGLAGRSLGLPALAVLGFAGALLHVLGHAAMKGLLFLGAGSVLAATGERNIERLGGLSKRMPVTAAAFLAGAVAISALPPFAGFSSEFLLYLGALSGVTGGAAPRALAAVGLAAITGLALVGGLAALAFTRAFGIAFLGEPRTDAARGAHEAGRLLEIPLVILASATLALPLAAPWIVRGLGPVLAGLVGSDEVATDTALAAASGPLGWIALANGILVLAILVLALVARRVARGVAEVPTWDCGYSAPSPRMQYTGSSYAEPATAVFANLLFRRVRSSGPQGYFPRSASFASETPDPLDEPFYRRIFGRIARALQSLRWLQHGRVQVYVLYVALTVVALAAWYLGFSP